MAITSDYWAFELEDNPSCVSIKAGYNKHNGTFDRVYRFPRNYLWFYTTASGKVIITTSNNDNTSFQVDLEHDKVLDPDLTSEKYKNKHQRLGILVAHLKRICFKT